MCDLEASASASNLAKIFGGHNTSWLKNYPTFSTCSTNYLLHLKKLFAL